MFSSATMRSSFNLFSSFIALFLLISASTITLVPQVASTNISTHNTDDLEPQTYIIGVQPMDLPLTSKDLKSWHESLLQPHLSPTATVKSRIIHSYSSVFTGFAAKLTKQELKRLEKIDVFLKAYPDRVLPLMTTHSAAFLGLHLENGFWKTSGFGEGVIIGVIDSGVTPGHPSFDDAGMPAPPSKWKGRCNFQKSVCNNKLIGARDFTAHNEQSEDENSPIDTLGHGTHTASTAAGNFVSNANVLGNGNGTAAGIAPRAHLAIYRVCSELCSLSAILAAMDAAVNDGVDVLSISISPLTSLPFYDDLIAIGSFGAILKGVFVSCAAGNFGPNPSSVSNDAPWILTVGASTMDRKFKAVVALGDGREFEGESLFPTTNVPFTPTVYPSDCGLLGDVKGKIVVDCTGSAEFGDNIKAAGGVAMILANQVTDGYTILVEAYNLPVSKVTYADGAAIQSYVEESKNATTSITFKGTSFGNSPAPTIASFSSRGPSEQTKRILKPDIIGPGVNILAAWPDQVGIVATNLTKKIFNIISGTSMSTPHLSGIAALIKSTHPDWSPAAIKSAMMTTSYLLGNDGNPIMDEKLHPADHFSMGAGHVDPSKAADPGLVYDISPNEYVGLLCALGYTDKQVQTITQQKVPCNKVNKVEEAQLNYPSIVATADTGNLVVNRTVTNVGKANAKYTAQVVVPKGVTVKVSPEVLQFSNLNEKKSFTVSLSWNHRDISYVAGNLNWISGKYIVRSPIVIYGI